jgi:uncharacterized protein (TIGR02147 family)
VDIYRYDDYRIYLRDRYDAKAKSDPGYSYRRFAADAGFSNPGFLNDVVKGRRKLSAEAAEKMIRVFELSPKEADYFKLLVSYCQSKKEDERQQLLKAILHRRSHSKFMQLNPALGRYYQDYHYPLVRNAVAVCDFRGDYEKLARFIDPPLAAHKVKKYVRDLCDWGLVRQDTDGRYLVTSKVVEPPETLLHLVRETNKEWIRQGFEALNRLPRNKRHISTVLAHVSRENYETIRQKVELLREEVLQMAQEEENPQRIAQLNIQFFPRSSEDEEP